jgi:ribosomal protein S18 acetylase RimI-like enzyme
MSTARLHIRNAVTLDLPDLGRLGVELARLHASFDAERFTVRELTEPVFEAFFTEQLGRRDAMLLVAELDGAVVGYAFVRMESASLEELRGAGAWLHDLYVDPAARGMAIGRLLVHAAIDAARGLGSDSLMLSVSPRNKPAQRLFEATGLRATMVEMRMELKSEEGA